MKKILLFFALLALLFMSCLLEPDDSVGNFWAEDFVGRGFYRVDAELLIQGDFVRIWAERGTGVDVFTARDVANVVDNEIIPWMMYYFGFDSLIINGIKDNRNTLEIAGSLVGNDHRLDILFLDIRDGFKPGVNNTFIGGYFWGGNFLDRSNSNRRSMIYVGVRPYAPGSEVSNAVIAHELQHLMNFVNSQVLRNRNLMDLWIDEGLSSAAEWIFMGGHQNSRVNWFNSDPTGLISQGNNFFVWGNREDEHPQAVLDDYATVYLFFQWLRLQSRKPPPNSASSPWRNSDIFRYIALSPYLDYRAVTSNVRYIINNARSLRNDDAFAGDWEVLIKSWLAANYINAPDGLFGYKNDGILSTVRVGYARGDTEIYLYPGEGVFSRISDELPDLVGSNLNIRYTSWNYHNPGINGGVSPADDILLTVNINTNNNGGRESGTITGRSVGKKPLRSITAVQPLLTGPFRIGAHDLRRINRHGEWAGSIYIQNLYSLLRNRQAASESSE